MDDHRGRVIAAVFAVMIMLTAVLAGCIMTGEREMRTPRIVKTILKNGGNWKSASAFCEDTEKVGEKGMRCNAAAGAPETGAMASGVVIEQSSRRVLLDIGMREKCYPASTTKILTALVALERLPLEMTITVPKQAEGVEGSSIYLRAGQRITVEDLLYGLMLRSGNDAAVTLAIAVAGSVDAFAKLMNAVAEQCGARDSHFVNPHGLHDDMHYTTAYDMALIAAKAYENEHFRRVVSSKIARITVDGNVTAIGNKNKLFKQFEGANGVKTGYTKRSGRCLVGGAEREGMQLISVVMDCPNMWSDTANMLTYCFENYEMVPVAEAIARGGGSVVRARLDGAADPDSARYPLKKDGSERLEIIS